jgi:hypothetical protein
MTKSIQQYKDFIDEIVSIKDSVNSSWVGRGAYPTTKENEKRNEILQTLSDVQRKELAKIVQESKEAGIHDLLALIDQNGSVIYQGNKLPKEPFGTDLNYDFIARLDGDDWPE